MPSGFSFAEAERDRLCTALLRGKAGAGPALLNCLAATVPDRRALYLEVLGPVLHRLGERWVEDKSSFSDVISASMQIDSVIEEIIRCRPSTATPDRKRAIFANVPGDSHTIGLKMAADLQRSKGWDIRLITQSTLTTLIPEIEGTSAQIVGLSAGSERSMPVLFDLLAMLRSRRPDIKVLVSGAFVAIDARQVRHLGVNACAASFEEAEVLLDKLGGST